MPDDFQVPQCHEPQLHTSQQTLKETGKPKLSLQRQRNVDAPEDYSAAMRKIDRDEGMHHILCLLPIYMVKSHLLLFLRSAGQVVTFRRSVVVWVNG